ncbi:pyruvate, phosphate dikinase [Vagococcus teuberi]|nr:pyruvate, phosphate dikinase [Vagococcus teuberi]
MLKQVYQFDEGNADMKNLLGGKGANLAEMTRLGLPVPPGFTITTEACMSFLNTTKELSDELKKEIDEHLSLLEKKTNKSFEGDNDLLLVSVRSGAKFSMPGMMDTILNLGLNDETVEQLASLTEDEAFAYDCYRRLLQMFGNVVFGIDMQYFENYLTFYKQKHGVKLDSELTGENLKQIVTEFKRIILEIKKKPFPQSAKEQLHLAIEAVFHSWNNERAHIYRELNHIPDDIGTAVNIQLMVFGNSGDTSGTGVAFTRNPATGENKLFGEYLINAQGEDVVAGIRTPEPIEKLKNDLPEVYEEFARLAHLLEQHYRDMQDIEFTVEKGKLYILQTRNGKRTAQASVKIAVDLVEEGLIQEEDALLILNPDMISHLLHPEFSKVALEEAVKVSDVGLPASPGSAVGKVCFDAARAKEWAAQGEKVILMRQETSPEDIEGMVASEAIVTSRGGMTSHAAVVARGMGTCCVAGCSELEIDDFLKRVVYLGGQLNEGDVISVDGSNGVIYLGELEVEVTGTSHYFDTIMAWAKKHARLDVRMNAETVNDIKTGLYFGADGIGLIRTEHMFFGAERLIQMRRFILSNSYIEREKALKVILDYQMEDFKEIFSTLNELPGVIRLLDPPLHEFMPTKEEDIIHLAQEMNVSKNEIERRLKELHEVNPMLGHRGCRLGMTYPELYIMQGEAIIRSAIEMKRETGLDVTPEIMIPLVGTTKELSELKEKIELYLDALMEEEDIHVFYRIGTMIELPRACLIADQLATTADFFSFGTNDLTQMTFGFSRDDAAKYINEYVSKGVLPVDPFQTIDKDGVGELIKTAVEMGRSTTPNIKIGVCGELGGDPTSIEFFDDINLDYVSCSPYRIPIAYIAAAQSTIRRASNNE